MPSDFWAYLDGDDEGGVDVMAADLYIHVFEGITEEDLKIFFSPTIGSKHFGAYLNHQDFNRMWEEVYSKISETPSVWVGEVSWLKAAIFDDEETFIPEPISKVVDIIGEDLPVVDDELISRIEEAMKLPNKTKYRVNDPAEVVEFLRKHKGKRVFTVSW